VTAPVTVIVPLYVAFSPTGALISNDVIYPLPEYTTVVLTSVVKRQEIAVPAANLVNKSSTLFTVTALIVTSSEAKPSKLKVADLVSISDSAQELTLSLLIVSVVSADIDREHDVA